MLEVGDYVRDNRKKFKGDIGILKEIDRSKTSPCYIVKWLKLCENSAIELDSNRLGRHTMEVLEKITIEEKDIPKLILEIL